MYRLSTRIVKGGPFGPHLDRDTKISNLGYEESVLFAIRDFLKDDLLLSKATLTSKGPDGQTALRYGWHDFPSLRVSELSGVEWTLEVSGVVVKVEFLV